ncbi:MAG TPA: isoleucine--tRNA ligase [Polyangiaceae bacterium]|nr:isoleucine--tRNA ligase [Polyangiaceae bacterium]
MSDAAKSSFQKPVGEFQLPKLEHEILGLWAQHGTEQKSLAGQGRKAFVFYDGPPFATGLPHYGHLLAGTIKDIVTRYFVMRGFDVERRFGWDCHGLPVESLIERELGLDGTAAIEAFGVPKFNAACRASVQRYTREWQTTVRRMARWVDFEREYKTMDPEFMETVWWVFKQLWAKGLIYEGFRIQPISPALGTPLSNFEVAQGPQERDPVTKKEGHKRRQDPSVTLRFKLEDEDAYLWAWTTTPWTLPSNLALAVHPDVEYVKVKLDDTGEVAYLEPGRLADYQARGRVGKTTELGRLRGEELVGRPYEPLFSYFADKKTKDDGSRWCFRVVAAEYVTTDSGTGIVHQAPAFGEDDYQVGLKEGLPVIRPMGLTGVFDERVSDFAGQFAKDADKGIIQKLKSEGKVVDQDTIVHPYPHCYRTDQPLLYMALSTWFMKVEQIKEQLVKNNAPIRWVPEHVGSGRFGNWLENARDWNLSRNRFWGTPIPVWRCDKDPSELECIGSVEELEKRAGLPAGSVKDLHRETVDGITFPSLKTPGGQMVRIVEVFDCWFESGSMPYAQNHYPFDKSKIEYVEHNLPADFIAEGLDQTRGWFYTLHVLSTALFGRPAFKNVIVNGMILAADGKKMSKRLKNYPDPNDVMENFGADALRAYLIDSAVVRAEPMKFGKDATDTTGEAVKDTVRLVVLPLWNAYVFLATYAVADGWSPKPADLEARPSGDLDRYILSRVERFVEELTLEYERYELSNLIPAFTRLCDDLNNWYIRRGRRRYWRAKNESAAGDNDKQDAYATLLRVLTTLTRAMAPVMPFFCEYLHQRLMVDTGLAPAGDSVHLRPFPQADKSLIDLELEQRIETVRNAIALGLVIREREKLGVRRPLARVTVASPDALVRSAIEQLSDALRGELNVKEVVAIADDSALCSLSAKANFKRLGKRLGPKMKAVAAAVEKLDAAAIARLERGETLEIDGEPLSGEDITLSRQALPGNASESQSGVTVVLDTNVTPELAAEGLAREMVSRIQNLRKDADLSVSQRIRLFVDAQGPVAQMLDSAELRGLIQRETLATSLDRAAAFPSGVHTTQESIDGEAVKLALLPA